DIGRRGVVVSASCARYPLPQGRFRRVQWPRMNSYGGRILFVDVTRGTSRVEALGEDTARALLGGNGLAARLLLDHVPAGIDPYEPANAVIFAVGPVTDTTVPGNSRACVATKSPLTGLFSHSTFRRRWPGTMKRTGCDASVNTGQSP